MDKLGIAGVALWKSAIQQQVLIDGLQVAFVELSATVLELLLRWN